MKLLTSRFLLICLVFATLPSLAQTDSKSATEGFRPLLSIGSGVLFERWTDSVTEASRIPLSFAVGGRVRAWDFRLEHASYSTSDGNQTLSVRRSHQTVLGWVAYEFYAEKGWAGYLAAGSGLGRTLVETRMLSNFESNTGAWDGLFAVAAGLRGAWTGHFAVRPEVRYESAESFRTKDARMGIYVQMDYIF